jgi:hypothetical protein
MAAGGHHSSARLPAALPDAPTPVAPVPIVCQRCRGRGLLRYLDDSSLTEQDCPDCEGDGVIGACWEAG